MTSTSYLESSDSAAGKDHLRVDQGLRALAIRIEKKAVLSLQLLIFLTIIIPTNIRWLFPGVDELVTP